MVGKTGHHQQETQRADQLKGYPALLPASQRLLSGCVVAKGTAFFHPVGFFLFTGIIALAQLRVSQYPVGFGQPGKVHGVGVGIGIGVQFQGPAAIGLADDGLGGIGRHFQYLVETRGSILAFYWKTQGRGSRRKAALQIENRDIFLAADPVKLIEKTGICTGGGIQYPEHGLQKSIVLSQERDEGRRV